MELGDARSGIDNIVVQAKLKIVVQILKLEEKETVKPCSANYYETRQDRK